MINKKVCEGRMDKITLRRIKELNQRAGEHWFDKRTMKFFLSIVEKFAVVKEGKAYFVSSERTTSILRLYSVRVCDLETGIISTVREFNKYETFNQAKKAMNLYIGETHDE